MEHVPRKGQGYLSQLVLASCALLWGCVTTPKPVVSAIPLGTNDACYVAEHAGLAEQAETHHLNVYWNGPSREGDIARQVELVKRAIHDKSFGIVLSPSSAYALNSVIERAVSQKIPVVILGPPLKIVASPSLSFVTSDVEKTGSLAAQRIHAAGRAQEEILIAGINPSLPGSQACARAFEVEIKRLAPQAKVIDRLVGAFSTTQAEIAIRTTLEAHPNVTAIYAIGLNDARGAARAVHNQPHARPIRIVANNYSLDVIYEMRHGNIDSLVIPNMRAMGAQAIENVIQARMGEAVQAQRTFQPILLTSENIDQDAVQSAIRLDWRR